MLDWIVRIVINGAALVVAARLVPDIHLTIGPLGQEWLKIALVAFVFALINTYLRPIVKALSFPINLLSLGLFTFVINAALVLLRAWVSDTYLESPFTVGGFPPELGVDAIVAAVLGSIIVSVVSTVLGLANFGRRVAGVR